VYGVPGRQPQPPPQLRTVRSAAEPAASGYGSVHASRVPPARSFTGGRPYPACRESVDDMISGGAPNGLGAAW
jgi:hypothetical protein